MSCENPPRTGESSISVIELNVDPVFKKVVIQNEMDEMHRARGHIPFDPNCAICQRNKRGFSTQTETGRHKHCGTGS